MWMLMSLCYALSALSWIGILLTALQGYHLLPFISASHFVLALVVVILYLFTETLIMFFFIGTGVNIREYCKEEQLPPTFYERSKIIKRTYFPQVMLNIVLVSLAYLLGGAIHTGKVPAWLHGLVFWLAFGHLTRLFKTKYQSFVLTSNIVREMTEPYRKQHEKL